MKAREARSIADAISEWVGGQESLTRDAIAVMNRLALGWVFLMQVDAHGRPVLEDGKICIARACPSRSATSCA